jgi:hypothetical protein
MKATLEAFLQSLQKLNREQLIQKLVQMKENEMNQSVILTEMRNTSTAMTREYSKVMESNKKLQEENAHLKEEKRSLCEHITHLLRKNFGRQSEKMACMDEETDPEDPLSEDLVERVESEEVVDGQPDGQSSEAPSAASTGNTGESVPPGGKGTKGKGEKKPRQGMNLDKLPVHHIFDIDAAKLDVMYGEGNWEIISWHVRKKVERIPEVDYVEYTHVPVIAYGPDRKLVALPFGHSLRKYSIATASLVASIMFKKFALGIPLYRQEWDLQMRDFPLSRQDMANWIVHFALNLFGPVYDWLWQELKKCSYIQSDETTLQVINDGRKAGRLSYMWVHMTSELCDDVNPIILFSYEMTRAADHLREYFDDYVGTMNSDAFSSYYTFAGEHKETITLAGCLMHARRPIALSAAVKGAAKLPEEEQKKMPEYRLLQLLALIFDQEKGFRKLSADERKACRNEKVRPLLDEYFQIVHTLDPNNPEYSDKMKKGIHYALNYETELRRFLDDGHIPCDNGACERHIRPFAVARKVWLFCNTIDGAKATAILYTLVETAKANNADVYYYLKYLLDSMPGHMDDHDRSFLADMMPWSEAFRAYAEKEKAELIKKYRLNGSVEPPLQTRCRSGPQKEASA